MPLVFAGARTVYDVWLVMMPTYAILDIGMVASALVCVSWPNQTHLPISPSLYLPMLPTSPKICLCFSVYISPTRCVSWQRLSDDVRDRHSLAGEDGARATAPSSSSSSSSSSVEMANADTHAADSGVLLHVTADAAARGQGIQGPRACR